MSYQDPKFAQTARERFKSTDPVLAGIDALFEKAHGLPQPEAAWTSIQAMRLHNHDMRQKRHAEKSDIRAQEAEARVTVDELTGLKNRAGMKDILHRRIEDIKRHPAKAIMVAFLDLDGFKELNDTCGHDAGDVALIEMGKKLEAVFRKTDVVCRLGGDEMVILLPLDEGEGISRTVVKAKVRQMAAELTAWDTQGQPFPVSASVGTYMIDGYKLAEGMSTEEIASLALSAADAAMYADKWHDADKHNSLPLGEDDPGHPKNRRLQAAREALLNNPEMTFGNN